MCENTAQTPGIQHRPIPVLFSLTKLEIAIFLSKIGVGFFHSSLANCMRPLMQNIQSILRGLTKEMFLLPSLVNGKLHHKLQTSFDNDTETKTEKIGLTFYLIILPVSDLSKRLWIILCSSSSSCTQSNQHDSLAWLLPCSQKQENSPDHANWVWIQQHQYFKTDGGRL